MINNMLTDNFGRIITYLRISVTDRCNLNCSYCKTAQSYHLLDKREILTYEEILSVIDVAVRYFNIKNYRLTGGEPLMRKNLKYLVSEIVSRKLNLGLTTNGVFLYQAAGELFKAGLRHINISLDTLSERKFKKNTGGNIQDVISGIKKAAEIGFSPIKINVVVDEHTNETAYDFLRWASGLNLTVKFIEKMPLSEQHHSNTNISELEKNLVEKFKLQNDIIPTFGPGRYYKGKGISVGFITAMTQPFCSRCNRIRLTADGKLIPCLAYNFYIDIKNILRGNSENKDVLIKNAFIKTASKKPQWHENFRFANYSSMASIGG